ncbi:hypothetical protein E2C01_002682 [Portunus trituberculatus]|uniref:Uncharacterized protein n=1 Tax=Portunus trituberculatus TaxID=210409 RepID=A0A5B7CNV6_PORTR|nr:hypothetical protein [Portunus trituberculatus]
MEKSAIVLKGLKRVKRINEGNMSKVYNKKRTWVKDIT